MASSYAQRWSDPSPGQSRRRGGAMLLAVLAHLLVILLLLKIAPLPMDRQRQGESLKTFAVTEARKAAEKREKAKAKPLAKAAKASRPPTRATEHSAPTGADASAIWALGKSMYKASDIAAIPSAAKGNAESADTGGDAGDSRPIGEGPGGRSLYAAQWYVEPTDAEMRTYMPRTIAAGSTGLIMCQTAARYHVENCREIAESPPGIGLTRALRQAAWQFKVLPPRIDGKPLIGAWVRIRFVITDGGISVRR